MENVLITSLFSNFLLHLIEELITNSVRLCYELCTLFEECEWLGWHVGGLWQDMLHLGYGRTYYMGALAGQVRIKKQM